MMRWIANLWWGIIHFGFRLLYNELAFTYDIVSKIVSLGSWRCWQRAVLKHFDIEPGALVLELAHGTGDLQIDLINAGYKTIGYDLSPYMGRIAQRKLKRNGLPSTLVQGRAQQLPFADISFDVVVSTFPTEFIIAEETLREVNRVLKDNGRFVIVSVGMFTGGGIIKSFLEWLYRITGQRGEIRDEVAAIFVKNGFEIEFVQEKCPRSFVQLIVGVRSPHEQNTSS
jgi:ubiquinone/menaquinone biosynthesis C-methylase UbiE